MKPVPPAFLSGSRLQKYIYLAVLVELLLYTYLANKTGFYLSPLLFTASGLLLCFFMFRLWLDRPLVQQPFLNRSTHFLSLALLLSGGILITVSELKKILAAYPIDARMSDVIPSIEVYVRRLLQHEQVYTVIKDFGYDIPPTYLPMQWLPYTLAHTAGFDYRLLAFFILLLGLTAYLITLSRNTVSYHELLLKALVPFGVLFLLMHKDSTMFGLTVEIMVVGYYLLLAASIFSNSNLLRAAALVLCLLSRFSFLFWVPLFVLLIFFSEKKKNAIIVSALVAAGILIIYVIPFLSKDWGSFQRGLAYYNTAAIGEWNHLNELGQPYHLYNGLGLANFFYRFVPGELLDRLLLLKKFHLVLSIGAAAFSGFIFYRFRSRIDYRIFSLISLKFCLVVFYAFIQVPYAYLILLSIFLSVFLLAFATRSDGQPIKSESLLVS